MILSQTAIYALNAVLYLAEAKGKDLVRVDEIAKALGVPRNYLSKILHTLARAGLLASTRGPRGGFRLRMDPSKLTLERVVLAFDELGERSQCLLGRDFCSDRNPCAVHDRWKDVDAAMRAFFRGTTVLDLLKEDPALG